MKRISIRRIASVLVLILAVYSSSFSQSQQLQLLTHVDSYGGYNDCWGYIGPDGREYALLGVQSGTSIIDITDPANATEIDFFSSATSSWKDIKTYQHYAYAVTDLSGIGLQIFDLSNLPNSVTELPTYTGFSTSHNIYIDGENAMLYAEGGGAVRAISLADPENPAQQSTFGIECHDIYARNNIVYVSEGFSGSIGVYDLSTPTNPTFVARINVPSSGYVHNAWLSDDGNFLMSTEETTGKTVKYWDIQNFGNATITDTYLGGSSLAHNAHIKGDYCYISHYESGLKVLDISDPNDIFEVGYYDTYPQGESPNFNGAWGAFPFFSSGKVLISDIQTGLYVVYFEGAADADTLDPNPPENVAAYSDYTTPTSMLLTWDDPTTYFGGNPLSPSDFTIEIERDQVNVASVAGGIETYTDNGLMDGTLHEYNIYAKVIATDSISMEVSVGWVAGGSPIPSAPTNLAGIFGTTNVVLTWDDPTTQQDGTPLDDLDEIIIYRDGAAIDSVAAGVETYTDMPASGFFYTYIVRARDNETPPNVSESSNETGGFIGSTPANLVWVGPDIPTGTGGARSGDSLFTALVANGESAFLTNNLFEFGTNLSVYDGVFVVLGIFSNNHVLQANSAEALALQTYLAGGGNLYLEGGDCFYYDPISSGGHDINPWFACNPLDDGSSDVSNLVGLNDLSAFQFAYNGENNWMDELQANGSIVVWQEVSTSDIQGLFYTGYSGGSGRSIGVVPSFGGMMSSTAPLNPAQRTAQKLPNDADRIRNSSKPKTRIHHQNSQRFVKKAAYYPELKKQRKSNEGLFEITSNGVHILANSQEDLMAAYLAYFRAGLGAPVITISGSIYNDTLSVNDTLTEVFTISNSGDTSASDLTYSIAENPEVTWLSVMPVAGTLTANQSEDITISIDASGLAGGDYATALDISSNDPANPLLNVTVNLNVKAQAISSSADSIDFDSVYVGADSTISLSIENVGTDTLDVDSILITDATFSVDTFSFVVLPSGMQEVQVTFTPPTQGSFSGLLRIVSNDPVSDTLDVVVSGYGEPAVGIENTPALPKTFAMSANYPNPFNPSTRISYQVPRQSGVRIEIYNMLGQKIRTLLNERKEPGVYESVWDGRNDSGKQVGSGVYLYRMVAEDYVQVRKMILMK